ncbi:MAG TPA: PmoA family protein [Chloroflexota bacterium]|nr:PmoA family protein [Chloroflexota bacterium]
MTPLALAATHDLNRDLTIRVFTGDPEVPRVPLVGYHCRPGERPYLHPVHAPGGGPVLTQDRPSDHPWQHGVFTGLHQVNGLDFWQEHRFPDRSGVVRFEHLGDLRGDGESITWTGSSRWTSRADEPILHETQRWTVRRGAAEWYPIDLEWTLRGLRDVSFGQHFCGGLAVRLVYNQAHEVLNAAGQDRAAAPEQPAAWCDVSAPFDGSRGWTGEDITAGAWHGVALFDHPSNFRYPSRWRVDAQGLINPSPSLAGPWSLPEGKVTRFRYRLIVHTGKADRDLLAHLHADFATAPA